MQYSAISPYDRNASMLFPIEPVGTYMFTVKMDQKISQMRIELASNYVHEPLDHMTN